MGAFLGLLGVLGFIIAIVMLFVKILFKKSYEYKKIGILACVALTLFIIGVTITEPSSKQETEVKYLPTDETIKEDNIETKESQVPTTEDTSAKQEQATKSNDKNYIPGLAAADIKLNLENTWNLVFSGPKPGKELAQDSGEAVDSDTGVKLICNIFETSPLHIQWVDFIIDASAVAGTVSIDIINAVAEGYFGYCATVPYEDAEPEKAKQWVEENVEKATEPGNVLSTQIGSVQFEMFGTEYFRTMRIKLIDD